MIFASKAFLVILPVVLLLYFGLRTRAHKYNLLLAASWLFYAWLSPWYLWVIVLLTAAESGGCTSASPRTSASWSPSSTRRSSTTTRRRSAAGAGYPWPTGAGTS